MKLVCETKESRLHYRCYCDLTRELDKATGLEDKPSKFYKHYIEVDDISLDDRVLGIRVPGCTVGGIKLEKHSNKIVEVFLGVSTLMKYPDEVKAIMSKYVGETIEFE